MLRRRVFSVAATFAVLTVSVLSLGGCSPTLVDARFRSAALVPVSEAGVETVADLQVIGTKKVMGVAEGPAGTPELLAGLYVKALEAAIASAPSGADVLVAPSTFEVRENKVHAKVTVMGYPARYKNFRKDENSPFSVRQLPGGATVVGYDKSSFTAKMAGDNVVEVQSVRGACHNVAAPAAPTAVNEAGKSGESTATSTTVEIGE